ncbi:ribonuclease H-like domain-containing protein [Tanacetum coccineum]
MDTGASSHLNFNASNLSTIFDKRLFPYVHVGDGKSIPVTNTCHSIITSHHRPLHLHNVLVTPNIIKNFIYVRQFTRDNNCTIEFDAFGFSMKDYLTRHILLRCDSLSDLYPVTKPSTSPIAFLLTSASTWHQHLGHPGFNTNGTWVLVPRPATVNVVRSMWLFKHKFHVDGTLSRYKARLVANGRSQQQGIDCDETFSLPATIRIVLSLSFSHDWPIHQLDVKNAFLHGQLSEMVYMHQPSGFVDSARPDYVCHLQKSLYGLKQTPRACFCALLDLLHGLVFITVKPMHHYFFIIVGLAYLLLYVDDIILTASSTALLQRIIDSLHGEFAMTDLGSLKYFLGISAQRTASGLFLSQSKFAEEIPERAHMQHCNPCRTPMDTESKNGPEGAPSFFIP